ncbi:hypothetical protein J1N35_034639, partial [Gossypium stocksii]
TIDMSTSDSNEDVEACSADGRNVKKVRFKEKRVDSIEMLVDPVPPPIMTWKDLLFGNTIKSSKVIGEDYGETFDFV